MGFLKRKAAKVDAGRWQLVADLASPTEIPMFNTPSKILLSDEPERDGFLLLSDQALYFASAAERYRIPIDWLDELNRLEQYVFRAVFSAQQGKTAVIFRMYPSILSDEFYHHLAGHSEDTHGRPVEKPIDAPDSYRPSD